MLLVVVGTSFMAGIAANRRAAERTDRAAARYGRTERATGRRAAYRADGLTTSHAGARGQAENAGNCTKRYEGLQHMHLLVKKWLVPARGSGATAQQEDDEQDGNRHAQGPQQDVAHLPFLLAPPLLKLFHASLQKVDVYRQQSPCRGSMAACGDFHYSWQL